MPFVQDFSSTQVLGLPDEVTLTDDSTGTDGAISTRRVYFTDCNGENLVEEGTTTEYELWPLAELTKSFDVLPSDKALNVRVDWVNSGGVALYTKTELTLFPLNAKTYAIFLIKSQSSNKKLPESANFYANETKLFDSIFEAEYAVELVSDISSAQAALDRAKKLIDKQSNFF